MNDDAHAGWQPVAPGHDPIYRLAAVVSRLEASQRADHDEIIALKIRIEESRAAHASLHSRDNEQLIKDFVELQRRLDILNHAHEDARKKEVEFATKVELAVTADDIVRRIEAVTATLGITLPRETFDAAQKTYRTEMDKRDEDFRGLFNQVQAIASTGQGDSAGRQRVQLLVFSLVTAAGILYAVLHH